MYIYMYVYIYMYIYMYVYIYVYISISADPCQPQRARVREKSSFLQKACFPSAALELDARPAVPPWSSKPALAVAERRLSGVF